MKTKINSNLAATLVLVASLHTAGAQGSLTPPGGTPSPVMKTLDQVEARTPLVVGQTGVAIDANGTITISQSGSYYLTGNRTITAVNANGITISANDVTLDLNGFSLICTGVNGGNAISSSSNGLRIRNGSIVGGTVYANPTFTLAGWNKGISITGSSPRVSDVTVRGVRTDGISISNVGSMVERAAVEVTGAIGIYAAHVYDSTAIKAGNSAITTGTGTGTSPGIVANCFGENIVAGSFIGIYCPDGVVTNSRGTSVGSSAGIEADDVINCRGSSNSGTGIFATNATNCRGTSSSGNGISAANATNCRGLSTSGSGLLATNASNCIGISTSGTYGMSVTGTASSCSGSRTGGTAINAGIAIGCSTTAGTITATQKFLGTP